MKTQTQLDRIEYLLENKKIEDKDNSIMYSIGITAVKIFLFFFFTTIILYQGDKTIILENIMKSFPTFVWVTTGFVVLAIPLDIYWTIRNHKARKKLKKRLGVVNGK